jgi:hypothetical protein
MHSDQFDAASSERHYCKGLAIAEERGMRPVAAHCHFGLGKLHRRIRRLEEADKHFTTADAMYSEMNMKFWLHELQCERGNSSN